MLHKLRPRSVYDVFAVLALVIATGGTGAYAANTIFSTDIVDGEVKSVDIGNGEINSADVKDESLTTFDVSTFLGADVVDGTLTGADIAPNTLTGPHVVPESLTGADIENESLAGLDIDDFSLGRADISAVSSLSVQEDPPSVAAQTCINEETSAISGKTDLDFVFLFPPLNLPAGLVLANAYDGSDISPATYRLCNVTSAAIDATALILRFIVIRVP